MKIRDYIVHRLIGSPFEKSVRRLATLKKLPKRRRHPELKEIFVESSRTDLALQRLITPSMNCIDVGSHLGSVFHLMHQLSPAGKHMAIEPVPYKNRWLRRKFPHADIFQVALSDRDGEATFYLQTNRSGFSGLNFHKLARETGEQKVETFTVKLTKLDDLVEPDLPIGFIKIDIEGAELPALEGSESILKRWRPTILFECTKSGLKANSISQSDVYDFFKRHNYGIFLIKDWLAEGEALDFSRFVQAMDYPFQAFNFLAVALE